MTVEAGTDARKPALGAAFGRLWAATAVANVADGILLVGLPLLALEVTRSPWKVALVSTLATAPRLLVSLHAGAVADRHDRRAIMLVAMVGRATVLVVLALAAVQAGVGLAAIYLAVVVLGLAEVFADTTAQSLIPMVVSRAHLGVANGRVVAAQTVANDFLGGPLAGVLVGMGGVAVATLPAVLYLLAGAVLVTLGGTYRAARPRPTSMGADIAEGLRHVVRHRVLRAVAALVGLLNLAGAAYLAVFVLWSVGEASALGLTPSGHGLLMAALAVGGTLGAVGAERLGHHVGESAILRWTAAVLGPLFLLPVWVPTVVVAAVAFVAIGLAAAVHKVVVASLTQRLVPDRLLGRVNATMRLLGLGTMPIGAAVGGALGSLLGLVAVFHLTGVLCLAGAMAVWRTDTEQAM